VNEISKSVREADAGFSLLELMISMAILLVISSVAIGGMTYFQKNYRSNELRKGMQAQLRATVEQMSQEIGQAGLVPSGLTGNGAYNQQAVVSSLVTLTAATTASTPTTLSVTGPTGMFYPGEWILLDTPDPTQQTGIPEEWVQITSITAPTPPNTVPTTITVSSTSQPHTPTAANPVPLTAQGVYPMGLWTHTAAGLPDASGHAPTLTIFGDINADGTMVIVKYQCPSAGTLGPLQRLQYKATNPGCGATATPDLTTTLIDNVNNVSGTGCQFTYPVPLLTGQTSGQTYALSVGISLTVQSQNVDPQTHQPFTITKNILNIQPRNIVNAYNLDNNPITGTNTVTDTYQTQFQTLPPTLSPQVILTQNCIP
jgi:prepilin-type N-terminal cleavage/methylation domain-containing protein